MKTVLIVNPGSAGGSTGRRWPRLREAIRRSLPRAQEVFTAAQGDATRLTREALEGGAELVISVGGDGTNNEVINGFLTAAGEPVNPGARFACIPRGTGCDFARWLGLSRDVGEAAATIAASEPGPLDVGRLVAHDLEGAEVQRYFLNISDFGIGGLISSTVNSSGKKLGGFLSFLAATLYSLARYRNQPFEVVFDQDEPVRGKYRSVIVANGRFFGGGMNIAPTARLDDGRFECVVIPDVSATRSLFHTPGLYSEKGILHLDEIEYRRVRRVEVRPLPGADQLWVEMDGENPGVLPAVVDVLPGVLQMQLPRPPEPAPPPEKG